MKKGLTGAKISAILVPALFLAASLLLLVFGVKAGLGRISEQRSVLSEAQKAQTTLTEKENILRDVQSLVPGHVAILANVLPEKNPGLIMISQLKNLATVSGVTLTTLKIGSENTTANIAFTDLTFDADGEFNSLISFLDSLKTLAPLSSIASADINQLGGFASANVNLKVYFAEYPTRLPSLTEPVADLSPEENKLLETLSGLSLPTFTTLTPQEPLLRENPF